MCKALVLCTTCDLPAKAKVLNHTSFNGRFGCTVCKQKGTVLEVGRGHSRVYRYLQPPADIRTHGECYTSGVEALRSQEASVA